MKVAPRQQALEGRTSPLVGHGARDALRLGRPASYSGSIHCGGVVAGAVAGGDDAGGAAITAGGVAWMRAELAGGLTGWVAVAGGAAAGAGALDGVVGARGDAAIGALALSLRDAARLTRARLAGATG